MTECTISAAASILGIPSSEIRDMKNRGNITRLTRGLVLLEEVRSYMYDRRRVHGLATRGDYKEYRRISPEVDAWFRIVSKVCIDEETGCWNWTGAINSAGYGTMRAIRFGYLAGECYTHRIMYGIMKNKIPDGLHADHLCRNPRCCNPYHLEAVTPAQNVLRGNGACALNARKTHCVHGHELSGDNLIKRNYRGATDGSFYRSCRTCKNNQAKMAHNQRKSSRIEVWVPKEHKDAIKTLAESSSPPRSVNSIIAELIERHLSSVSKD